MQFFFSIGNFHYNSLYTPSLYTQAVSYTTYFELGEPVVVYATLHDITTGCTLKRRLRK